MFVVKETKQVAEYNRAAVHLSCSATEKPPVGRCTWSIASCGFTDRFNYNMAQCCRGDGLLLTCCFPGGKEVSQSAVEPRHG